MVCGVVGMAAGVGVAWARREGVVAAALLSGVAVVPTVVASALSVLAALVSLDVTAPFSTVSAIALVLVPPSALPVSLLEASASACCKAVA